MQGSPTEDRDQPHVKYEELTLIDPANLKYAGELAERKSAIQWVYRALGSPPEEQWNSDRGHDGTIMIISNRLGLEHISMAYQTTIHELGVLCYVTSTLMVAYLCWTSI